MCVNALPAAYALLGACKYIGESRYCKMPVSELYIVISLFPRLGAVMSFCRLLSKNYNINIRKNERREPN